MAGERTITCYLDCVSPYSRFAMLHLERQAAALASHKVRVEYVPFFLGGINQGSGNKPPWLVPAKAAYSRFETKRAMKFFDTPKLKRPAVFPIVSLLPQRAMCYIKHAYNSSLYKSIFAELWVGLWEQDIDISKPEPLLTVLSRHLPAAEAKAAVEAAQSSPWKEALQRNTNEALDRGAYGAPWLWVNNGQGVEEPFFGSDRFHYVWDFLGLPHSAFTLLEADQARL